MLFDFFEVGEFKIQMMQVHEFSISFFSGKFGYSIKCYYSERVKYLYVFQKVVQRHYQQNNHHYGLDKECQLEYIFYDNPMVILGRIL